MNTGYNKHLTAGALEKARIAKKLTEKQVKDRVACIITAYKAHNEIYTFTPFMGLYGTSGHPDRILVIDGKFIGLEIKRDEANAHVRPNRKPTPSEARQRYQAEQIRKAGGSWACIHANNLPELTMILDRYVRVPLIEMPEKERNIIAKLIGY